MRTAHFLIVISLVALVLFFLTNRYLRGYMRSEASLASELRSPPDSIDRYTISTLPPFKYRVLFPWIIKASYNTLFENPSVKGFYYVYIFWSAVFYVASACLMFLLLQTCGFYETSCFFGSLVYLVLPPMLMAYTLPVHTREDTLAYTILMAGLICLLKEKQVPFLLLSVLGILCRETLLLLPFLYFFFSPPFYPSFKLRMKHRWISLFSIAALPGLVWIGVRYFIGLEKYDAGEGLRWNLNNPEQVIGFLFIAFNVCWVSFIAFSVRYHDYLRNVNQRILFFYKSSFVTLAIILLTTFFGGIFNEIRLIYLFAPWMIVIFMAFIGEQSDQIKNCFQNKNYWWYGAGALVLCAIVLFASLTLREKIIIPGKYAVPYHLWIIFSVIYIFLVLLFLPFLKKNRKPEKSGVTDPLNSAPDFLTNNHYR